MKIEAYGKSVQGSAHAENEDSFLIEMKRKLFAVADGVTIPSGGKLAAELAVKFLSEIFSGNLKEAFLKVNEKIVSEKHATGAGYTTLSAAKISGEKMNVANVGDSPIFLIRKGKISELTRSDRALFHSLSQAIGEGFIHVNENELELKVSDTVLLLTDGITDVLSTNEILKIAQEADAETITEKLIEAARKKRTEYDDDKTAITIKVRK
jgi:serine/threonine protein phosphatase PrpC